jgi:hypothetical protein
MSRMPLYFYTKSTMVKPYVRGWYRNALNDHAVRWMWIDPAWRTRSVAAANPPAIAPRALATPGKF